MAFLRRLLEQMPGLAPGVRLAARVRRLFDVELERDRLRPWVRDV